MAPNIAHIIARVTKGEYIARMTTTTTTTTKNKSIEETYTKVSQLEHILLRPDTYVGSVDKQTQAMWVLDAETKTLVNRPTTYVPGLYKIFDEILVNAADHKQRDASMNRLEVSIDATAGSIRVWNNGAGIPIAVHQEHGIYVPELVFGHLLTGSNFDDGEAKTTGGRNGYGAKLANIFSTRFVVETADGSGRSYRQEFQDNMTKRGEPVVVTATAAAKKGASSSYTCITFYPDLARFRMDRLDADIVALMSKRVYDVAGTASGKLTVVLNGDRLEGGGIKDFKTYLALYRGGGIEPPVAFERVNDRWEIGVGPSIDGTFQQVSFVNSICTAKGGSHVEYIADQIVARLAAAVKKKNKGEEVKPGQIKNHLAIFVNALIVNPAFDTQTKETLTTKAKAFGSVCVVSDKMIRQIEAHGAIVDSIVSWTKFKQSAELAKKSGTKRSKLVGVPKLDDANAAGTSKSAQCTLILTEGDSAKALAVSGLGVVGRDFYGVFPLKGKLLNVREAAHAQMMKNEEIQNIVKILGLQFGKTYTDVSSLRYGHLMIMADQDHDGSHIKGLLINFLHFYWPSLLQINGFLQQFITPIVKVFRGKVEKSFFTIPEYKAWCEDANTQLSEWKNRYYKGLGTSTAAEAKAYFSDLATHEIDFEWSERSDDAIDKAFAKKRVEDRKQWLLKMEPGTHIDYDVPKIAYDTFVDRELILFSQADNTRSIAHFMDGMKPSQRKVLFACFKRNLKQEIKAAQLAGYISEHAAYHHGEASLTQTIIGMAQNFVGSNNINLLKPCGQFGTRLMGGKDAASPRYVFTKLENITRCIFHPHDDALLEYLEDDGMSIEPSFYVPVIPMALVNGSDGIGTGWSSTVPTFNPREIVANLRCMLEGGRGEEPLLLMKPWYRGFTGEVLTKAASPTASSPTPAAASSAGSFTTTGKIEAIDERTVLITELPVGKWTSDFKVALESMMAGGDAPTTLVKDFKENHTDTTVRFTVTLTEPIDDIGDLVKKFKLESSVSTSNMHMFDTDGRIRKFEGPMDVMKAFFPVRLEYYGKRKAFLADKLTAEWDKLDNRVKFVTAVIGGELVVANRKKRDLEEELRKRGFKAFRTAEADNADNDGAAADDYDYLLSMKLWSLTAERVLELTRARDAKRAELDTLLATTAASLWLADLDRLELALDDFDAAAAAEDKDLESATRAKAHQGGKAADKNSKKRVHPPAATAGHKKSKHM